MKDIIILFIILGACLLFSSSITEAPSPCDSPFVGDHSGAPGETDCSGCHISPVNPDTPDLYFALDSNQTTYIPGKSYLVHLKINRSGHDKFGFVCTSLDSVNKAKGTFDLIDTISTRKFNSGGRRYVSHTPCGADSKDSIYWNFYWIAPAINSGALKMYMSFLVADHDHTIAGDTTYTRILTLKPTLPSNSNDLDNNGFVKIYPAIFNNSLKIEFDELLSSKEKRLKIIDITGRIIVSFLTNDQAVTHSTSDFQNQGIYFLQIECGRLRQAYKLIKQ